MSKLRRYHTPGNWYFVTCVTYKRTPLLVTCIGLFNRALEAATQRHQVGLEAWVVLPDHFHLVFDSRHASLSAYMKSLKTSFASLWRSHQGTKSGRVWQHRFWDHIIRDQADFNAHVDYIHYNPVKHVLVESPFYWPHSSIHQYLRDGAYDRNWGKREPGFGDADFGE